MFQLLSLLIVVNLYSTMRNPVNEHRVYALRRHEQDGNLNESVTW